MANTTRRLAAAGATAALVGIGMGVPANPAHADSSGSSGVRVRYTCDGGSAAPAEAVVDFTELTDPGLAVGDQVRVSLEMTPGDGFDLTDGGDGGPVADASVRMNLKVNERVVALSGDPDLDADTWSLSGGFVANEAGRAAIYPGSITIDQVLAVAELPTDDPSALASPDAGPSPSASPSAQPTQAPTQPFPEPSVSASPSSGAQPSPHGDAQRAPALQVAGAAEQQPREGQAAAEKVTTCEVSGDPAALGIFEVDAGDGDGSAAEKLVTTNGGVQWEGTWQCVSDSPELFPSFEGPGAVSLSIPEEIPVGEAAEVVPKTVSFDNMPPLDTAIAAGDMTAVLGVGLNGSAVPTDAVEVTAVNSEPVEPGAGFISFEQTEPTTVTPTEEGELELGLGDLVLTTKIGPDTATVTCAAVVEGSGAQEPPADAGNPPTGDDGGVHLPVTGTALTGLISAAVLAVIGGALAMLLARRRKSSGDALDE